MTLSSASAVVVFNVVMNTFCVCLVGVIQRANYNIYDLIVQITVLHTLSSTVWDICEVCQQVVRFCIGHWFKEKFWMPSGGTFTMSYRMNGCYKGECIKGIVQANYFV